MNTFTRLYKDNTIQGGDGQRQAGTVNEEKKKKKKKENKDVLMS